MRMRVVSSWMRRTCQPLMKTCWQQQQTSCLHSRQAWGRTPMHPCSWPATQVWVCVWLCVCVSVSVLHWCVC